MPHSYSIPAPYRIRQKNCLHRGYEIINYDSDNAYPQRMLEVLRGSATGIACANLYAKFIEGRGFEDEGFYTQVVNYKGHTIDQILRLVSADYSRHRCFAIHFNYNLLGEITTINRVPLSYVRYGLPDSNEYIAKIAVYNDWARDNFKIIKRKEIEYYDTFNPDPVAVVQQIEQAGTIQQYKGQILFYTGAEQAYTVAPHDSIINDLIVDAGISSYYSNVLSRGFLGKSMVVVPYEFEDEDRAKFKANIQSIQGTEGNDILVVEAALSDGEKVEVIPIQTNYNPSDLQQIEQSTRQKIMRAYNQPSILHSSFKETGLSSADQIENAFMFYNQHTIQERRIMSEVFEIIAAHYYRELNTSGNFEILPLKFGQDGTTDSTVGLD